METPNAPNEVLMQAIYQNDVNLISCCLNRDININKICLNGMTLIGAAAQTGNLPVLKALIEFNSYPTLTLELRNEPRNKPQFLQLQNDGQKGCKNIGYFVVCRDLEDNEFGDGPTPEGMEALEWDMEITETNFPEEEHADDVEINMYKWYANILNRTSLMLESPERDFGRLDRRGQSVLHYAVNSGNIDMVEYLITTLGKELSINQNDACSFSPLHMAAANGDIEMIRWLLRKGANINAVGGRQRQSVLHVATREAHLGIVRLLVDAGADINAVDFEEKSILTLAVRNVNDELVRYLVKSGARVNHEEPGGVTPLRLAVWANNSTVVSILLTRGARLVHSHYLLHTAVSNNNLEVVKLLVAAGATLNARDDQGHTPLMLACSRKNLPIANFLLTHGSDVNAASHIDGKTALHICVQDVREAKSIHQLVELLVRHGADMNASSYQGSVLFYSIILENRCAATALVRHGADVNLRDERAYVDNLSLSKRHGDLDLVKLLVYGGFRLSEMTWDPRALRTQSLDSACDFLIAVKTNPLNLRDLCRIVIRRSIGSKELMDRISALPLPSLLHKYLSLEIL